MSTARGLTGKRVGYIAPGSDEWRQYITASKVAAILGHSPHKSKFGLWHELAGTVPPEPETDEMRRGHYLEPAVAAWWADQHPDARLYRSAMYQHRSIPWAAATPDRIVRYGDGRPPELLECKSAANPWEWGEEGTDEIPPYYYDQGIWQAGVLGVQTVHVGAIFSGFQFKQYQIQFDLEKFQSMLDTAHTFRETVIAGEKPSIDPLDGHLDTYRAVRYLHPDIELTETEVTHDLAIRAQRAKHAEDAAKTEMTAVKSQLIDVMGTAKDAVFEGKKIARRQAKGDGTPYVVLAPQLKKHDLTTEVSTIGKAA
jgi:putative phage-type endonuclease